MTHTHTNRQEGDTGVMNDVKTKTTNLFAHFISVIGEHLGHNEEVA